MKKSLNNTIRGKRLVVGDENEVTSHEILVEDKDGKITLKQRGSDGSMETLSGGGVNVWYYCYGTTWDKCFIQNYAIVPYKGFKDFLFSTEQVVDNLFFLESPQFTKTVMVPADSNVKMYYNYGRASATIYINVSQGAKGLAIPNMNDTPLVGYIEKESPIFIQMPIGNPKALQVYSFPYAFEEDVQTFDQDVLYDAASNILYYFSNSSSMTITINPELESTLRIIRVRHLQYQQPIVNDITHKWEDL